MATLDRDFGTKLELMERAVGFRFPAPAFSNVSLARLLQTTQETMSRKKIGNANVTARDISVLTQHFGLGRHGFEVAMFTAPLEQFTLHMRQVEARALGEELIDADRKLLFDLAREQNGRMQFDLRNSHRGGIGAVAPQASMPRLRDTDEVAVRVTVPADGHLIVVNDDGRRQVTCLMPSQFAPDTAVRAGTVRVPTAAALGYFPVAGPAAPYRLVAVWLPVRPQLPFLEGGTDGEPRDLAADEFRQLAGLVREAAKDKRPFKVAVGDYAVVQA